MSNPWLTKNPFMSMWLSSFNQLTGHATSVAKREIETAVIKATKQNMKAITAVSKPKAKPAIKKTKRAKTPLANGGISTTPRPQKQR